MQKGTCFIPGKNLHFEEIYPVNIINLLYNGVYGKKDHSATVKLETNRSRQAFIGRYSPPLALRISEKNFGRRDQIKSVPLYAVFCIDCMI